MFTLDTLKGLVQKTKPAKEDILNLRFDSIVACMEQEKVSEAIPMIENVFKDGHIDIRLVAYFFYGYFLEHGIKSLKEIFPLIISLIHDHWEHLCPVKKRDKHAQNSIDWLFSQILRKLKLGETRRKKRHSDSILEKLISKTSLQDIEEVIHAITQVREFFDNHWVQSRINERILSLQKWFEDSRSMFDELTPKEENKVAKNHNPQTLEKKKVANRSPEKIEQLFIATEKMQLLCKKLKTFETLIENEEYVKAALISNDISSSIENFDPSLYFPKLFSRYFALLAKHIDTISKQWDNKESPSWKLLEKLYQIDLEKFIEW